MSGTVRRRTWTTTKGATKTAWVADYFDEQRVRRQKHFTTKREATDWLRRGRLVTDWVVWSEEHGAWWAPGKFGYTRSLSNAGRYTAAEADEIVTKANAYRPLEKFNEVAMPDPLVALVSGRVPRFVDANRS